MKKPYAVQIEEISRRTVVIYAEDPCEAEAVAEVLCSNDEILFDYEDFDGRNCRCIREATAMDLSLREKYNMEDDAE